jgi:hypothetical protein
MGERTRMRDEPDDASSIRDLADAVREHAAALRCLGDKMVEAASIAAGVRIDVFTKDDGRLSPNQKHNPLPESQAEKDRVWREVPDEIPPMEPGKPILGFGTRA